MAMMLHFPFSRLALTPKSQSKLLTFDLGSGASSSMKELCLPLDVPRSCIPHGGGAQ